VVAGISALRQRVHDFAVDYTRINARVTAWCVVLFAVLQPLRGDNALAEVC
jgi:hypothetical protein